MKKVLSILSAVAISATTSAAVVSCSNDNNIIKEASSCNLISANASSVENGFSTVSVTIDQTVESSFNEDEAKLFSVVNDSNAEDQKDSDKNENNLKDVEISDVKVTTSDVKKNKKTLDGENKYIRFNITFKVKIESVSEHHVFEWIKYSNKDSAKYNVYKTFMVKLPGVKQKAQ